MRKGGGFGLIASNIIAQGDIFPCSEDYASKAVLEAADQAYHDCRAQLMIDTNKGLTPTYNRFHAPYDDDPVIQRLRGLHAEIDRAVLRA